MNLQTELHQTIQTATKVMSGTKFDFVTIWETKTRKSTSYGFNFDANKVGHSIKENGVTRTVKQIING